MHSQDQDMGTHMKTTLDLNDFVFQETKAFASRHGLTMRAVVEHALYCYLAEQKAAEAVGRQPFRIRPWHGGTGLAPEFADRPWADIREEANSRPLPE